MLQFSHCALAIKHSDTTKGINLGLWNFGKSTNLNDAAGCYVKSSSSAPANLNKYTETRVGFEGGNTEPNTSTPKRILRLGQIFTENINCGKIRTLDSSVPPQPAISSPTNVLQNLINAISTSNIFVLTESLIGNVRCSDKFFDPVDVNLNIAVEAVLISGFGIEPEVISKIDTVNGGVVKIAYEIQNLGADITTTCNLKRNDRVIHTSSVKGLAKGPQKITQIIDSETDFSLECSQKRKEGVASSLATQKKTVKVLPSRTRERFPAEIAHYANPIKPVLASGGSKITIPLERRREGEIIEFAVYEKENGTQIGKITWEHKQGKEDVTNRLCKDEDDNDINTSVVTCSGTDETTITFKAGADGYSYIISSFYPALGARRPSYIDAIGQTVTAQTDITFIEPELEKDPNQVFPTKISSIIGSSKNITWLDTRTIAVGGLSPESVSICKNENNWVCTKEIYDDGSNTPVVDLPSWTNFSPVFGTNITKLDSKTLAVGFLNEGDTSTYKGGVYICTENNGTWSCPTNIPDGASNNISPPLQPFGAFTQRGIYALNTNEFIVPHANSLYTCTKGNSGWNCNNSNNPSFVFVGGYSISALNTNKFAKGVPTGNRNEGGLEICNRENNAWNCTRIFCDDSVLYCGVRAGTLDLGDNEYFGRGVAWLNEKTLAVSSENTKGANIKKGAVYICTKDNNNIWSCPTKIDHNDITLENNQRFGYRLSALNENVFAATSSDGLYICVRPDNTSTKWQCGSN